MLYRVVSTSSEDGLPELIPGFSSLQLACCPEGRTLRHFPCSFLLLFLRRQGEGPLLACIQRRSSTMVDLFLGKVLVKNNRDKDELDTEREISLRLQNRILMLFFGSGECERCQEFAPTLKDFYKRLTDEFYVERSAQLVLLYVSMDPTEEKLEKFLKDLPKRCLFLAYEDSYRKELELMFEIEEIPTVVVLRPDGSVLSPNAVSEICTLGPDCFQNWQEGAELIDRNFMLAEEFDDPKMRSVTDPLRRLKYKVETKKKKKKDGDEDEEEEDEKGPWG
ncbi:hypothetical protein AGOR_G00196510 [Albula goreensis]|uniref:Thioredoxin-like fold domain-containing protein n=1 Tax=Albula goreensis TaxID=1534307 RepID=A0A8T3CSF8_9TELE|nr:hypothetical protein AGOR_G00196510 [Albula goreensis]